MKIAQVPPLYEAVPPKLYGGTERVVAYLADELVMNGHDVTIFGTGDSKTHANLVSICERALRLNSHCKDAFAWHIYQLETVMEHADEFDVIHFHNDYLHFPYSKRADYKHITTLHGRLDLPELQLVYSKFHSIPLVSISNHQRRPLPNANWMKTVYHGLPSDIYKKGDGNSGYMAFLGRISPEKQPDVAIEIAKKAGIKLKIAAKVDNVDKAYFQKVVKPLLDDPLIEYVGEIDERGKQEFLGNALALLFPINWPEPFGIVMIEALANGTPVIAFNKGSVQEVIEEGVTGYIVNTVEEAVKAIEKLPLLSRDHCRYVFEQKYTAQVMANNYLNLYTQLTEATDVIEPLIGVIA